MSLRLMTHPFPVEDGQSQSSKKGTRGLGKEYVRLRATVADLGQLLRTATQSGMLTPFSAAIPGTLNVCLKAIIV